MKQKQKMRNYSKRKTLILFNINNIRIHQFQLPPLPTLQPKIKSSLTADKPEDRLKLLTDITSEIYKSYIPYLLKCNTTLIDKKEKLQKLYAQNENHLKKMQQALVEFQEKQKQLKDKLQNCTMRCDNISIRTTNVLQTFSYGNDRLSEAEINYEKQLEQWDVLVKEQEAEIKKLQEANQKITPPELPSKLPQKIKNTYRTVLPNMEDVLEECITGLKKLDLVLDD